MWGWLVYVYYIAYEYIQPQLTGSSCDNNSIGM
jgi:hypothetical protein